MERRDSVDDHLDRWVPSELLADLQMSPAAMTGRLDTLERRGFVRRRQSSAECRRLNELPHRLLLAAENPDPPATSR